MSVPPTTPLVTLWREEFSAAKFMWNWSYALRTSSVLFSTVGAFPTGLAAEITTILALLAAALAYMCEWQFEQRYTFAERARREYELEDGLGWPIPAQIVRDLRMGFTRRAQAAAARAKSPPDPFFASTKPPGPERLLENLSESLHYHRILVKKSARLALLALAILVGLFVAAAILVIRVPAGLSPEAVSKGLWIVVVFLASGGLLKLWRGYEAQAHSLDLLHTSVTNLATSGATPREVAVLQLWHEFNYNVLLGPPVPDFVYKRYRRDIERTW